MADTPEVPQPGEQYMVKHPSVDGQWQISNIIADPVNEGGYLVEFPDGSRYSPASLQIGGKVAREEQPAAVAPGGQPQDARTSPLNAEYEAFRTVLTQLNAQSKRMFQLPLAVLLTMVSRLATQHESNGTGHMGSYDGIQIFVPDQETFDLWLEDYLLEIQTREAGKSPE